MRFIRVVLATFVAILLMGAGLLSAAAGLLAQRGRTSLTFDLLAHFAPIWLAAGLVAVIGGLAFRGRERLAICLVGLVGVVACGSLMAPEFTRDAGPRARATAAGQLKIIQFNVWHHSPDFRKSLDWVARQDPDIVVLEETTPALRDLVAAQNRWQVACPKCEVMILSKRPAVNAEPLKFTGLAHGVVTRATFRDARGDFTVLGVHNAWPTDEDQPMQEARLAQAIAMFPRTRTIVAGDFNSAPWSFARRRWDKAFGIPRRERALFTWPAQPNYGLGSRLSAFPFLPLDHVYAGPGWATVSVRRGPRLGSDHYPVVLILAPVSPR